jgi:hypothetical protein
MFDIVTFPQHTDSFYVYAAEFFNKKLSVYQIQKGTGSLTTSKVIDGQIDAAYSVKYLDIDGDGVEELLVNNHESDNKKAGVFTYSVPKDNLIDGTYVKTQIASGF